MCAPRKILFLDRDGVINQDPGDYTWEIERFHFLPGVISFAQSAHQKGYALVVITNQGGIAKGLYTLDDVHKLHEHMTSIFVKNGVPILDIFISEHHNKISNSLSRKPSPLMIERALALHHGDRNHSFIVGDKESDVLAGENAGIRGVRIERNSSLMAIHDLLV
jgi:D-glycero-D-manno-heptose 1,7-bisphosphate phosphatase